MSQIIILEPELGHSIHVCKHCNKEYKYYWHWSNYVDECPTCSDKIAKENKELQDFWRDHLLESKNNNGR